MGIYINPKDKSKEDFLADLVDEGRATVHRAAPAKHFDEGRVVVCLVDNIGFTAAAIAYSARELQAFAHDDGRRKIFFKVEASALADFIKPEDISHDV